jgi:hypothetical protein
VTDDELRARRAPLESRYEDDAKAAQLVCMPFFFNVTSRF